MNQSHEITPAQGGAVSRPPDATQSRPFQFSPQENISGEASPRPAAWRPPLPVTQATALVTGGTGFLGRRIVARLLAQNRPVTVLARRAAPDLAARGVRFITASLDEPDSPALRDACAGIATVFHTAAKVGVWGRHDDYYRANVLGTRALLASARAHGTRCFIHTSTPSVVYNALDLANANESLPLTTRSLCPSAYAVTKALAEREVLAANTPCEPAANTPCETFPGSARVPRAGLGVPPKPFQPASGETPSATRVTRALPDALRTVALRPHLIWGADDPHLIPRVLAQARAGRLRIVGAGRNRVDMVHIENATDAHLLAEQAIARCAGRAYFITNGEPVVLWDWLNALLAALGEPRITKKISLRAATAIGACCETAWRVLPLRGEPPMTRFIAAELAKDHWFDIAAARRDLGYAPRISMEEGTAALVAHLKKQTMKFPHETGLVE